MNSLYFFVNRPEKIILFSYLWEIYCVFVLTFALIKENKQTVLLLPYLPVVCLLFATILKLKK